MDLLPGVEKIVLISVFLLFLISIVVSFRRDNREPASRFLVAYFWANFYTMFVSYLVQFGSILQLPHLFRTGFPVSLLVMPLSFLYVRQSLQERKPRWTDLVHLVPALFCAADFIPVYLLSADMKVSLLKALPEQQRALGLGEGMVMPSYGYTALRFGLAGAYSIAQVILVRRAGKVDRPGNQQFIQWLWILAGSQFLFYLVPLMGVMLNGRSSFPIATVISGTLVVFFQGCYLLFHPDILYGTAYKEQEQDQGADEVPREEHYTDEMLTEAGVVIENYMMERRPYLRGKFKVQELADATGLSVHTISAYVNRKRGMNFFGYINHYRINDCIAKFNTGEHENKTLEALAEECGFQNRTTFIRVFKQVTGKTPTEYLNALKQLSPVSAKEQTQD